MNIFIKFFTNLHVQVPLSLLVNFWLKFVDSKLSSSSVREGVEAGDPFLPAPVKGFPLSPRTVLHAGVTHSRV